MQPHPLHVYYSFHLPRCVCARALGFLMGSRVNCLGMAHTTYYARAPGAAWHVGNIYIPPPYLGRSMVHTTYMFGQVQMCRLHALRSITESVTYIY